MTSEGPSDSDLIEQSAQARNTLIDQLQELMNSRAYPTIDDREAAHAVAQLVVNLGYDQSIMLLETGEFRWEPAEQYISEVREAIGPLYEEDQYIAMVVLEGVASKVSPYQMGGSRVL